MGSNMRYWFMPMVLVVLVTSVADSQEPKKKDNDKKEMKEITEFAGKNFAQWKKELHHKDPAEREVAFRAIVMFPLARVYTALPDIIQELKKHNNPDPVDLSVRVNGVIAIGKILQAKHQPDENVVEYFNECAKTKKQPDPKVVEKMLAKSRPDPKLVADAVNIFRACIKDTQIILKVRAAQALPYVGPEARKAIPEIKQLCQDPSSWEVRKEALFCLTILAFGEKGPDMKLLPEFTKGLSDSSAQVRMTAVSSFAQIGLALDAKDVIDKGSILKRLDERIEKDSDFRVRIAAHVAIMTVNHKPSLPHLSAIAKYLGDIDPRVRLQAIHGMASTGSDGKKAMPAMVSSFLTMVEDEQLDVGVAALTALVQIGATEVIPNLRRLKESYEKGNPVLSRAIEDTIDQLDFLIKHEKGMKDKKDKGDKDKKDDKK
jgi:HEAT repeat protein